MRKILVKKCRLVLLFIFSAVALQGCGGGDFSAFETGTSLGTPNSFLTYFNPQAKLAAGTYTIVAATASAAEAGSFSVLVTYDDGFSEVFTGTWASSAGQSATPAATCSTGNLCFTLTMQKAGGIVITLSASSGVDPHLYLVDDSSPVPLIVAQANANVGNADEQISLARSVNDSTDLTTAYYAAVDPSDQRTTLEAFQTLHGFGPNGAGADVHVIFRDTKDLGYGRDMYMKSYANTICSGQVTAFYVRNFSVALIPGFAYGPINLEAAINEDLQYHFGSNAIEFSNGLDAANCSTTPYTKFFTFKSDYSSPGAPHPRLTKINLDARGEKAMPMPCITCHGGKLRPLSSTGSFVRTHANDALNDIGDTKARLQAFEVDTFEFSAVQGHTKADYAEGLRILNHAIFCTYAGSTADTNASCATFGGGQGNAVQGEWDGDFARELLNNWYGNNLDITGSQYNADYTPVGWIPNPGVVPSGADTLFKKVIGPNCFVCHGKRGALDLGQDDNTITNRDGKDIDFSTWAKFISHADDIARLVYKEGRMPLGLLNYNNFWDDPQKSALLASMISGYVSGFAAEHINADGIAIKPGKPVANAGLDRVVPSNTLISLNAQSSLFVSSYQWSVISSPLGSTPILSGASNMNAAFQADVNGNYTLQLSASNGSQVDTDTLTVAVAAGTNPKSLDFTNDIAGLFSGGGDCTSCHMNGGTVAGIPVWWTAGQPTTPSLTFYQQVMTRVNLVNPENSLLLRKPSGIHHYGGVRTGFDTSLPVGSAGRADYDTIANWIMEGAPE
ncbi:MAG: hypothetical protein JKY93_04380 [Gammaproteobacteria bacterium]|nr:hypothetical protein [Gammaproteobacteria bacterium]